MIGIYCAVGGIVWGGLLLLIYALCVAAADADDREGMRDG